MTGCPVVAEAGGEVREASMAGLAATAAANTAVAWAAAGVEAAAMGLAAG